MIFCFSGTGNSRYIAGRIAQATAEELTDLNEKIRAHDISPVRTGRDVIVVTPTYAWRIPRIVRDWIARTEMVGAERVWFVMDCGSEIGNAARYNRLLAEQKHLQDMGTAQVIMPHPRALLTPGRMSSKTKQAAGSTPSRRAASR